MNVLNYVRDRDPRFREVPDHELIDYLGNQHPQFLQDQQFARAFEINRQRSAAAIEGASAASAVRGLDQLKWLTEPWSNPVDTLAQGAQSAGEAAGVLDPAAPAWRPAAATAESVGGALNTAGNVAAGVAKDLGEDWRAGRLLLVQRGMPNTALATSGQPVQGDSFPEKVLVEAARALPTLAGSAAATAAGVPAPLAFGAPMAAQTYEATGGDPVATAKSALLGAAMPGLSQAGAALGERIGTRLALQVPAEAALPVLQTAGRVAGSQSLMGAAQLAAESPELLDLARQDPSAFRQRLAEMVALNLVLELPGLPGHLRAATAKARVDEFMASGGYQSMQERAAALAGDPNRRGENNRPAAWARYGMGPEKDITPRPVERKLLPWPSSEEAPPGAISNSAGTTSEPAAGVKESLTTAPNPYFAEDVPQVRLATPPARQPQPTVKESLTVAPARPPAVGREVLWDPLSELQRQAALHGQGLPATTQLLPAPVEPMAPEDAPTPPPPAGGVESEPPPVRSNVGSVETKEVAPIVPPLAAPEPPVRANAGSVGTNETATNPGADIMSRALLHQALKLVQGVRINPDEALPLARNAATAIDGLMRVVGADKGRELMARLAGMAGRPLADLGGIGIGQAVDGRNIWATPQDMEDVRQWLLEQWQALTNQPPGGVDAPPMPPQPANHEYAPSHPPPVDVPEPARPGAHPAPVGATGGTPGRQGGGRGTVRGSADPAGEGNPRGVGPGARGGAGPSKPRGGRSPGTAAAAAGGSGGPAQNDRGAGVTPAPSGPADQPAPTPARPPAGPVAQNHVLPADADWIPTGAVTKVRANLAAIQALKQIEAAGRLATPEEKVALAQFTGWGAVPQVFDEAMAASRERSQYYRGLEQENWERKWGPLYDEVRRILTPEEWNAAQVSLLNAHYTSRSVINGIWAAVEHLGFRGGRALEPSGGIGHFIGLAPASLRDNLKWTAVEKDSVSARILKALYPQARVIAGGFEDAAVPPNSQDLVISNVPFAKQGPADDRYPPMSLHNYFFAHALEKVRPGGIVAFITSDSTMDNPGASRKAREYLADRADLLGAIRLPNTAFKENAGTEVTTDIIFLRKFEDGSTRVGPKWVDVRPMEGNSAIKINEYFVAHPDMMLGKMTLAGTMYRENQQALEPVAGAPLAEQLRAAVQKLPAGVYRPGSIRSNPGDTYQGRGKVAGIVEMDGKPGVLGKDGAFTPVPWADDRPAVAQTLRYIKTRDIAKDLIAAEMDPNVPDADLEERRRQLNEVYDDYVKRHGPLNGKDSRFLEEDVEYPLMLALETAVRLEPAKPGAKPKVKWVKADILQRRTVRPVLEPERVDTSEDALAVSINYRGKVDLAYCAKLLGLNEAETASRLETAGLAFEDPATGKWDSREVFLSGNVREKLKAAEAALKTDARYEPHVAALKAVQPPDVPFERIKFQLGSTWIPSVWVQGWLKQLLGASDVRVSYTPQTGTWSVKLGDIAKHSPANKTEHAIWDWSAADLVEAALNLKDPVVYDDEVVDGKETRVRNPEKSLAAKAKQNELKDRFVADLSAIPEAPAAVAKLYNELFNGHIWPKFDAPTWKHYPAASDVVTLNPHQKQTVTRMLTNSTLVAHGVGTGKTYILITGAMEMRRLGLARKPMLVVQNSTIEQFAVSFRRLYPGARILVPTEKQREAKHRQRLVAQISTGDWDAVIIPQSFLTQLPDDPRRQREFIQRRIDELKAAEIEVRAQEKGESPKVKDLVRAGEALRKRLEKLADRKTDNVVTFEQLGVDALLVDEAHEFKRLEFDSKMDRVKGLDKGFSERGLSMLMKVRWVQERARGRNVVFATGTPVSNTLAEAWNMMRYLRPDILKSFGMENFDSFAAVYGRVLTEPEMNPGGAYKEVTRFRRFQNGQTLITAWKQVADVVFADTLNLPNVPKMKTGGPILHAIPQSPWMQQYVRALLAELQRYDRMRGKDRRTYCWIPAKTFVNGRKASIDPRMINADVPAPEVRYSKIEQCADEAWRIYQEYEGIRGTQLVFLDMFRDQQEPHTRFNAHEAVKAALVKRGVPAAEVVIVSEGMKGPERAKLFAAVNEGKVRVLIGTTPRMGVGVNVQDRLVALHHVDTPPRPMDIEQRQGRILRQRTNPEAPSIPLVEIHSYGVERTLDAAMFQKLSQKQQFINQLLRGDVKDDVFEDPMDAVTLTFDEQMAAFSGDPRNMILVGLQGEVRQLQARSDAWDQQFRKARTEVAMLRERVPYLESRLAASLPAAEQARRFREDLKDPVVTLPSGQKVEGKDIGPAVDAYFKELMADAIKRAAIYVTAHPGEDYVGLAGRLQIGPVALQVEAMVPTRNGRSMATETKVVWKAEFSDEMRGGVTTWQGLATSLRAGLDRVTEQPAICTADLANAKRDLAANQSLLQSANPHARPLADAQQRMKALTDELQAEAKANNPEDTGANEAADDATATAASEAADAMEDGGSATPKAPPAAFTLGARRPRNPPNQPPARPAGTARPPTPNALVTAVQQVWRSVQNVFAPQTIDAPAGEVARIIRAYNGTQNNVIERADEELHRWRQWFDTTPVPDQWQYDPNQPLPHNYRFIDLTEQGTAGLTPEEIRLKDIMRRQFDEVISEIQRFAPDVLKTLIDDYFPHIWEDPDQARSVMANFAAHSPLEGSKGFLKKRTLDYFVEGLRRGLQPVSDNPVDLHLLKLSEMLKFLTALRITTAAKAAGARKFVYIYERAPEGWEIVEDPTSRVIGPPVVEVEEAYDAQMRAKFEEVLRDLGVTHRRQGTMKAGRWGEAHGDTHIRTRFAGPDEVMHHELGHVLDVRFHLHDYLVNTLGPVWETERQALADARIGAAGVSPQQENYIRSTEETAADVLRAYLKRDNLLERLAPNTAAAFERFLDQHPELAGIRDIRPAMEMATAKNEVPVRGMVVLGHWYMPSGAAQVLRNYLSPGLNRFGLFRGVRQISNLMNGAQLGFSAFHLGFTSYDAAVSQVSLGLMHLLEGGAPLRAAAAVATAPVAPVTNALRGWRVRRAMLGQPANPRDTMIARLAIEAGLRASQDPFYRTEFSRRLRRAWHGGVGPLLREVGFRPWTLPAAAIEQLMRPIMEFIVPWQKLGVFAAMADFEMRRLGPGATVDQIRAAMARAADSTENRMGQMVYDNMFYNRTVKDILLVLFRAYGWQLGKYRESIGAGADTVRAAGRAVTGRRPHLTHRMAYVMALVGSTALIGAVTQYLMTGEGPQEWRDYFFPKVGGEDRNGKPIRAQLPSYMKDLLADWHDVPDLGKMGGSIYHKLNPAIGVTVDMLRNRDFYDTEIRSRDAGVVQQGAELAAYLGKSFLPFSVQGALRAHEQDAPEWQMILPFFGITTPRRALTMTEAEQRAADAMQRQRPQGANTKSERAKQELKSELTRDLREMRQGRSGDVSLEKYAESFAKGDLTRQDLMQAMRKGQLPPLAYQVWRISADEAMRVWDAANPAERRLIAPVILHKLGNRASQVPPAQRLAWAELILRQVREQPSAPASPDPTRAR